MKINKQSVFQLLLLSFFLVSSLSSKAQFFFNEKSFTFSRVIQLIDNYYVDTVNQDKLVESAIKSVLKDLDPHSTYIPKKKVKAVNEPLQGNFEGIGIIFNILNDTVYVISPISGGPSEKVGIQAGDRIVTVEGETIAGIGINSKGVRDRLLGEKGTKVKVGVKRKNVDKILHFTITRDKIPIHSLDASYMLNDSTGYIKLNRFARTTMDEFHEAIDSLRKNHTVKHLVLDLTGNGGGYLETAFRLADEFLAQSRLIVYTEGKNSPKRTYEATSQGDFEKGKVIVMIDEGSASASEIVSGAIQDWDRGLVVGRRSFGKGLVQRQFRLPDSSMIRLTVAEYYTPTGRLIQKPYDKGAEKYRKEILHRYKHGELVNKDSINFPDSLKYKTLVNNRTVYGGGGIMPDVFVPVDTTHVTDYLRDIIGKGILYKFVLNYVDNHRKELTNAYPSFETFNTKYEADNDLIEDLTQYAEDEGLDTNSGELSESRQRINLLIKAQIARDLWSRSEYHQIMNQKNPIYQRTKTLLESAEEYRERLE